jgi:sulfhydrogenase subunit beta (sulfur reductase)
VRRHRHDSGDHLDFNLGGEWCGYSPSRQATAIAVWRRYRCGRTPQEFACSMTELHDVTRSRQPIVIQAAQFEQVVAALLQLNYRVMAPVLRDGAIVIDEITSASELPVGVVDRQEAGEYRAERTEAKTYFGFNAGPESWKRLLFPPRITLFQAESVKNGAAATLAFTTPEPPPKMALVGVRACDLRAIQIQDEVFLNGPYTDPIYKARRQSALIVAVNCGQAANTCFCTSMGSGPRAEAGYDLALTEVVDKGAHYFVAEVATTAGHDVLDRVTHRPAESTESHAAAAVVERTARSMVRSMQTVRLKELLSDSQRSPIWEDIASRCLTCGNCTLVCPTCFCSAVEDTTDLSGQVAERSRRWDSCFTTAHSYIHGGSVRPSSTSKYRQWMTHKLSSWWDQFGSSGCVGCGRCIAWCPVGIDITAEVARFQTTAVHPELKEVEADANT